jgi:hypothetical protein
MLRSWKLIYLVAASLAALAAFLSAIPKILSETIPYIRTEILPQIWGGEALTNYDQRFDRTEREILSACKEIR